MKNFIRLILVGLVFCAAGNAQSPTLSEPTWTTLQPDGEIFSIELPSTISSDRSEDKSLSKFWTSINGDYFMIFSEKLGKPRGVRIALEYIRSRRNQGVKRRVSLIETERYDFKDDEGFYHSVVSFNYNQRAYLFHGITRTKDDPLVKRFLSSLKVNGLQARQTEEPEKKPDRPVSISEPQVSPSVGTVYGSGRTSQGSGNGTGQGWGSGSGTGYGLGNGSGNPSNGDASPKPVTTPLKVLSKPKAWYTELARIYEIQGVVRLRVTFLASGELGAISPVSYLPFGLTTSALRAARMIKFEPRTVNGVPQSSIATFEYGFTIY